MKKLKFLSFFLFFLFNINLSVAEITFTQEIAARPDHVEPSYVDLGGATSNKDSLQVPSGGTFNHDGTLFFSLNNNVDGSHDHVMVMRLATPYDLRTASRVFEGGDPLIDIASQAGNERRTHDIDWNLDGTKLFLSNNSGKVFTFDLEIPYSFAHGSGMSFTTDSEVDLGNKGELEFNNDGTKMYFAHGGENPTLDEYNLTTAFDISTKSLANTQTLSANVDNGATNGAVTGFTFNDTGTSMYILIQDTKNLFGKDTIFQYRLRVAFDTSTAVSVGQNEIASGVLFNDIGVANHILGGLFFDASGSKMYLINDGGQDHAHQLSLSCHFGVAVCMADTASNIVSNVEFAKKNIHYNNSTMFKRFEWIKRNRDNENLNSFNINLKSYNPILASLTNKLQASLDNLSLIHISEPTRPY